jgi:hypothetical protein
MRKGQAHLPETKAKIAATKAGKLFTDEHAKAISEALKGRKKTAAHKAAISAGIKAAQVAKLSETPESNG